MAIYAIGDVQGCFAPLRKLLKLIKFDPSLDQLWFTGDLVNRGPQSLETLRYVKTLGDAAVTVLGNHDIHLLAVAFNHTSQRRKDTFEAILKAPDRDDLLDWLRHQPLFHHNEHYCLVHAGLPPQWGLDQTLHCAAEVETVLRGDKAGGFFAHMYGDTPNKWSSKLTGWERMRFITNCFTRLRYCRIDGTLDLRYKGPPGAQPQHLIPWFDIPDRKSASMNIVFGHWSTLGFRAGNGVFSLDTGCLWGGQLTALRLGNKNLRRTSLNCPCARKPQQ